LPEPAEDRFSWGKVGVIAVIGFAVGVAWPRLAGIKLGPNAPGTENASARAEPVASAPPGSVVTPVPSGVPAPLPATAPSVPLPPAVTSSRGVVLWCRNEAGDLVRSGGCGPSAGFDSLAVPRLKKLAACPAAEGASGKFLANFYLDFKWNKITVEV